MQIRRSSNNCGKVGAITSTRSIMMSHARHTRKAKSRLTYNTILTCPNLGGARIVQWLSQVFCVTIFYLLSSLCFFVYYCITSFAQSAPDGSCNWLQKFFVCIPAITHVCSCDDHVYRHMHALLTFGRFDNLLCFGPDGASCFALCYPLLLFHFAFTCFHNSRINICLNLFHNEECKRWSSHSWLFFAMIRFHATIHCADAA